MPSDMFAEQLLSTLTTKPIEGNGGFWFCGKLYHKSIIFNLVLNRITGYMPSLEVRERMRFSMNKWNDLLSKFDENEAFLKEWKADPSVFFKYYFGDDYEAKLGKIVWEDDGSELLLS